MLIALIVVFVFAILAGLLDAYTTDKGIRKGVAVEGNDWLVSLAGTNKPTFRQIELFNLLCTSVICVLAVLGLAFTNLTALGWWAFGGLIADGGRGVQQYFAWKKLGA